MTKKCSFTYADQVRQRWTFSPKVCDMLKEFAEKNPFPALTVRCIATTETVLQVVLGMKTDYDYSLLMNCLEAFLDEELARRGIILYDSDACGDSDLDDVDDDEEIDW